MTSWFRPWKENSKEVKCITLAQVKRIMQKPSICKIMVDARSRGERFRLPTRHINQYEKKEQGNTTIFVASVYHPVDELKNTDFINILSSIMPTGVQGHTDEFTPEFLLRLLGLCLWKSDSVGVEKLLRRSSRVHYCILRRKSLSIQL